MKNKFLAIFCLSLFLVSACGNDEDPDTNESASVVGVWGIVNGEDFSYLTLLSNNTFLYAENDLSVNSSDENGLEVGTYQYDSNDGEITFNVLYDDNAPGNDSGIGDIGTPVTFSAALLDQSSRLSLLDGELIFNKMDLGATFPVIGVWSTVNGAEFSYLVLLSNNTFLYAENDLSVNSGAENGLEVGTFFYDQGTETMSFNVIYDDNDPGNDSGVGNIGDNDVVSAVLTNEDNILTIAGLELSRDL